jgi:hypothetical protein
MRKIAALSAAVLSLSLVACKGKSITKDQCQQLVDHGIEIMVKQQGLKDVSPDIIKQAKEAAAPQLKDALDKCVEQGTEADFNCGMKAQTMDEFMACDNK